MSSQALSEPDVRESSPVVNAIGRIARMNRTLIGGLLRGTGVFPGQEVVLMQLFQRDGRSQSELVRSLDLDPSTVTKMLQRMERAGWIQREQSRQDRRVVMIRLTTKGRELEDRVAEAWRRAERATVSCLSESEQIQLRELLDRVDGFVRGRSGHYSS